MGNLVEGIQLVMCFFIATTTIAAPSNHVLLFLLLLLWPMLVACLGDRDNNGSLQAQLPPSFVMRGFVCKHLPSWEGNSNTILRVKFGFFEILAFTIMLRSVFLMGTATLQFFFFLGPPSDFGWFQDE